MCNQRKKGLSNVLTPNTLAYFCCWCEIESVLPPNPCTLPGPQQLRRRHVFQGQVTRPCWLVGELDWGGVGFRSSPSISEGPRGHTRRGVAVRGCLRSGTSTSTDVVLQTHTRTHTNTTQAQGECSELVTASAPSAHHFLLQTNTYTRTYAKWGRNTKSRVLFTLQIHFFPPRVQGRKSHQTFQKHLS